MFSHIMLGSNDLDASRKFYDASLGALGVKPGFDNHGRIVYATREGRLLITKPIDGAPACHANGGTIGFKADSPEQADAWHAAGLANGGTAIEGDPGERPGSGYYLAYLRDPAGNKLCALHSIAAAA